MPIVAQPSALSLFFHLTRFHILAIASLACLTFGWLMTGRHLWLAAVFCVLDWFVVNLMNRVADLAEDRANGIVGTDLIARSGRLFEVGCALLAVASLVFGHFVAPQLTLARLAFTAIGFAYNYKVVPSFRGLTRFKEMYFIKNFSSGLLFILSTILYPMLFAHAQPTPTYLAVLIAFFLPLEITYEIIYDLRDVEGDAALKVPTFPVVHGIAFSHRLIWLLLALSALPLLLGAALHHIELKEFVLIGGVLQQAWYFKTRLSVDPTPARCIFVTYLGAAQILSYHVWIFAGLPMTLAAWRAG